MNNNNKDSGFLSFDIHRHTSDEVEFRTKCKKCGMSDMDVENSCLSCDCDWFQSRFNNDDEEEDMEDPNL